MVIDSHQHFWKYNSVRDAWITDDMKVLKKDFLPNDFLPILKSCNIDGCVAVQADQSENETHFLLTQAHEFDFVKGVVGWIDLLSENLDERLLHFSQFKKLKGFRHVVQGEPKGFLLDERFIQGVKKLQKFNFTYDLLIFHHQLEEALNFIANVPDVKIVIDHLAKPSIKTKEKTRWELNMSAAASFKNVYCKISGMVTEANWKNWKAADFTPYLDELFEIFGVDRLMYGSDWPVCTLAAGYQQQLSIVTDYITRLSFEEKQKVMGKNAERFYNL